MDKKQIKEYLRDSLELKVLWGNFLLISVLVIVIACLQTGKGLGRESFWLAALIVFAVFAGPYLILSIIRTLMIFRKAGDYFFCRVTLSNPMGGLLRNSIRFRVLVEDPVDGQKYFVDTHALFATRGPLGLEEYVGRTVTIGHNRETGMVVVIG